jgi:REP element-mobilizing transposase RayT
VHCARTPSRTPPILPGFARPSLPPEHGSEAPLDRQGLVPADDPSGGRAFQSADPLAPPPRLLQPRAARERRSCGTNSPRFDALTCPAFLRVELGLELDEQPSARWFLLPSVHHAPACPLPSRASISCASFPPATTQPPGPGSQPQPRRARSAPAAPSCRSCASLPLPPLVGSWSVMDPSVHLCTQDAQGIDSLLFTQPVFRSTDWEWMTTLAHLLTFRSFGTWVTGDARGSVQHATGADPARRRPPIAPLARAMRAQMREAPVLLGADERECVELAVLDACQFRNWTLHALGVRSNHVHVVVAADAAASRILAVLKARATYRLREHGLAPAEGKVWARGGHVHDLSSPAALERAAHYVTHGQGPALAGSVLAGGRFVGR